MKRLLVLALLFPAACGGGSTSRPPGGGNGETSSDPGQIAAILTYSQPCKSEGFENWVLVTYEGGFEEMMTRVQTEAAKLGSHSTQIQAESNLTIIRTRCTTSEAGGSGSSSIVRTESSREDADLVAGQHTARTDVKRTDADLGSRESDVSRKVSSREADQTSGEHSTKTDVKRTDANQESRESDVKRNVTTQKINLLARTLGINPLFYRLMVEQLSRGNLVIWAKQMLALLEKGGVDVQRLMGNTTALETTFIVDQTVSVIKVSKSVASDPGFDSLPAMAGIEDGRTLVYRIHLKNASNQPIKGVAVIDVLPSGLELDDAWLSDAMRRRMTSDDKAAYEIYAESGQTMVVWGLRDPLPAGGEFTITFGAVAR